MTGAAAARPAALESQGSPGLSSGPSHERVGVAVSHNLAGQRLGRKGRVTRERILAAAQELIDAPDGEPLSMSAVARRAALGLTSLYNYFADLSELVAALLEPVMATAEDAYLAQLRSYWPDPELGARCLGFVAAYHDFWRRNTRLLHMRNAMADARDARMMQLRIGASQPIMDLLVRQMGRCDDGTLPVSMATMVMIGIERSITIATDRHMSELVGWNASLSDDRFVMPGARLLELTIRDVRASVVA